MKEDRSAVGYIIAYGGSVSYKIEARKRLACTVNYIVKRHGISHSRLKVIDGGYREFVTVQLIAINPGDPEPTPYATVNREAVRMKKPPRQRCP
jgi:hypothetical protein